MRIPSVIITCIIAILPLAPLVAADPHGDCDGKGTPALGVITLGGGGGQYSTVYIDDRNYFLGNGIWMYYESNGESGLQRGGSSPYVLNDNEICSDDSDAGPDTLFY